MARDRSLLRVTVTGEGIAFNADGVVYGAEAPNSREVAGGDLAHYLP